MLTALVLICSLTAIPDVRDCTSNNARVVMRVPAEFANPVTCLMHGQGYLAHTSIGQEFDPDDRVKIVCVRSEKIAASILDR
ncbi:MAG: hypothetical protein C5B56_14930 [Proteobacteria bacterium]|nr:MAG: hypothetical protein C5B56_14930 [Pseudomonadota bacterium]